MIGQASAIVDHASVEIGNDVWTGPHVYVTDANHGYEDVTEPIGASSPPPGQCASARARGWPQAWWCRYVDGAWKSVD